MHDIYDPPPAPEQDWVPPRREPLIFTTGDLVLLVGLCALLFAGSVLAWRTEPELAIATAAGGSLVILESWFTALGFLHRCPPLRLKARWLIFLAASGSLAGRPGRGRDHDAVALLGIRPHRLTGPTTDFC